MDGGAPGWVIAVAFAVPAVIVLLVLAWALPARHRWMARMLGLRSRMSSATELLEPHVFWGERGGRQVHVRLGPDEKIAGGTTMLSNRHVRLITVVRAELPEARIVAHDGTLRDEGRGSAEIAGLLAGIGSSPDAWDGVRVVCGPDGAVASRPAVTDAIHGWLYDLWLCERLADGLAAPALPPVDVGPGWTIPYGLGRRLG
jgi:hypothetical protein